MFVVEVGCVVRDIGFEFLYKTGMKFSLKLPKSRFKQILNLQHCEFMCVSFVHVRVLIF